jgi:hypothetical protein
LKQIRITDGLEARPAGPVSNQRAKCGYSKDTIVALLLMGDLLVWAKLVTEDVNKALARLVERAPSWAINLMALGTITKERLDSFIHRSDGARAGTKERSAR